MRYKLFTFLLAFAGIIIAGSANAQVTISGILSVCEQPSPLVPGTSTPLVGSPTGGTWSSSNTANVVVSSSGVATGYHSGPAVITYTVGGASTSVTVDCNPYPEPITVPAPGLACAGFSITLLDYVTTGGTWSVGSTTIASIDISSGDLSGISSGWVTVTYTLPTTCSMTRSVQILGPGPVTGASTVCQGATIPLSVDTIGGVWTSGNATIATVSSSGVVTGVAAGTATISYSINGLTDCPYTTTTKIITVTPVGGTITGPSSVCAGATMLLSDASTGGEWSSSNTAIANIGAGTGIVAGLVPGTAIVSYRVTNSCGTGTADFPIAVNTLPVAGTITGGASVCSGLTISLADGSTGGVWSSSNTAVANVGSTGIVLGVAAGGTTIVYSVTNACATATASQSIAVNPGPVAGSITGTSAVCAGLTIGLVDGTGGGGWSSSNAAVATVGATGIVTGVTTGSATIVYSVTNTCGTATATQSIAVNTAPVAGSITGASSMCPGTTTTLTDGSRGGAWSSSNTAIATVGGTGIVTGVATGGAVIFYSVTNACATATASESVTVNTAPTVAAITGASGVCAGSTISLTDGSGGGVWSSGSTGIAVVGGTGIVTGLAVGSVEINYSVTSACGTGTTTQIITVSTTPGAGAVTGVSSICAGSTAILSDGVGGGVWSSSNTTIAIAGGSGIITGIAAGSTAINYSVTNACGTATASQSITIDPAPFAGAITGASSVCAGSAIGLDDATGGGVWASSNTAIAVVSGSGTVTGIAAGTTSINYSVSNACGTATTSQIVAVNAAPAAGTITGPSDVCQGSTISLADPAPGGVWSSSNTAASVSGGVVSGIVLGTSVISYSVTNTCGTASATRSITISTPPVAGTVMGASSLCIGATIMVTDASGGGVWSSSSSRIALVGATGVVTGAGAGTATITYSVTNTCATATATQLITVNPTGVPSAITGPSAVCEGSTINLADTTSGGVWSTTGTSIITTAGTEMTVTGVAWGSATISYSVSNICGTATATKTITISKLPDAGAITGALSVCAGSTIVLTDVSFGGAWGGSNDNVSVSAGIVTGISPGTAIVSYSITNVCGTSTALADIAVVDCPLGANMLTGSVDELTIFPNPSQGTFMFTLSSHADGPVQITITNIVGEKVKVFSAATNTPTTINIGVSSGIYFLSAVTGQGTYTAKIIMK